MVQAQPSKRLRVTVIDAGVSGILMGIKILQQKHLPQHIDFHIYEKSPEIGGTWFENRYPGCACDVPSHLYQYSFAPNTEWSMFYATSSEIQSYLKAVVKQYNLNPHISLNSPVIIAVWNQERGTWTVTVQSQNQNHGPRTLDSEILINAGGSLNHPQMPDFRGLDTFAGPVLHTAAWDDTVDLAGKRIAIIGAGTSAVQLLPEVQKVAEHVDIYIRTPSWISPPVPLPPSISKGHVYSEAEKQDFREDKEGYLAMRKGLENQFNGMFRAFEKLIPKFEAGCRRVNPGEEYLLALQEENVRPIFDSIREIMREGVVMDDNSTNPGEILIAATGFNTSFRSRFPIIGLDRINLQDVWETNPTSYFGIAVAGFPNYLMFLGPNTPISNGSLMATSAYITRLLLKTVRENIHSFTIKPSAQADFNAHTQSYMGDMVWTGSCRSWYKNNVTSKITALWPGSSLHYMQVLAEDRWEDFEWQYTGNRFGYWGRGISWVEDLAGEVDCLGREGKGAKEASVVPGVQGVGDLSFYLVQGEALPVSLASSSSSPLAQGGQGDEERDRDDVNMQARL
ncbi:flavin-containing monooxygenase [Aspergillus mulundensis]|uniref:Monooxygenase n=1 Tax=Aspergillus mulundensis TaxID=1810919 RepID=A0A3D8SIJ9_9EURO|nr:Uncharacterized protein DSM5745_02744 [Aspergillus mulundensis]RDW86102.1 Uncharacterized protein DSM5745_02744 [Aspergillus mulundensis]